MFVNIWMRIGCPGSIIKRKGSNNLKVEFNLILFRGLLNAQFNRLQFFFLLSSTNYAFSRRRKDSKVTKECAFKIR